jgi:hypothetical protein
VYILKRVNFSIVYSPTPSSPLFNPQISFPTAGLTKIDKIELNRRGIAIYRIVKVVTAP